MSSLGDFFSTLNFHFKDHDLFCIIKRIDKDQDGSICYSDFVEFILPIKPYTRLSMNSALNKSNNSINPSPLKPKPNAFPAHFRCFSCNVEEQPKRQEKNERNPSFNSKDGYNSLNPARKLNGVESHNTYITNLTYTQSNRDSFRTPTKNSFQDSNRQTYFSTKPLQNNKIENNETAKEAKAVREASKPLEKEPHKSEIRNAYSNPGPSKKYQSKSLAGNQDERRRPNDGFEERNQDGVRNGESLRRRGEPRQRKGEPGAGKEVPVKAIINEEVKIQLKDLFYLDKSIRLYMEELYEDFDLDLLAIYRFFDNTKLDKIDSKCLELRLKEFEIFISKFEIYCFVERYDLESKGFLSFQEFSQAFLMKFPFPDQHNPKAMSSGKMARNQSFEKKLARIVGLMINFECDCMMLKKVAEKIANFSFLDLFVEHFKGEIPINDFLEFVKKYELQKMDEKGQK